MAVASVKKIKLYVHKPAVDDVLAALQKRGICEISASDSAVGENSFSTEQPARDYSSELNDINYLTSYLAPYYTDPVGSLARMLGERDEVSVAELAALSDKVNVADLAAQIRKIERRLTELKTESLQAGSLRKTLAGLSSLETPLSMFSEGTRLIAAFLGTGSVENLRAWQAAIAEELGEDTDCFVNIPAKDDKSRILWGSVFYLREHEYEIQELCLRHGITKLDLPASLKGTVSEEAKSVDEQLKALEQEKNDCLESLKTFTDAHMDEIRRMGDYAAIMKTRQDAENRSEHTEQVVLLSGWTPSDRADELKSILAPFEKQIDLTLSDPAEDDDPPILLENPAPAKPFQMLTMLYGAPTYGSIDPSFPMMPFFLLFFGMCYADAGYGAIIAAIAYYFLKKYKKMPDNIRQALILVVDCGIATILFGAVTGSWMGNMIDTFPFLSFLLPIKNAITLIDPMKDPMLLLGISMGLGIVHIYWGIILAAYGNIRNGEIFAACADQGGWLILLTGLITFGAGSFVPALAWLAVVGKYLSLVGAAILILTQGRAKKGIISKLCSGVLSLYNVTSYLGDVLSYSRLLALGLVGGAVAMIINMMSMLCSGTAYVGWIIGLLIFVGGHLFSMVINILGAFVHPLRLQFVEFFGKFYSSGGTAFVPFCCKTSYVNLSDRKDA